MAKDNSGSVMVAFVIGALTGAAVALLFAPATRRRDARVPRREGARGPDKARDAWTRAATTTAASARTS